MTPFFLILLAVGALLNLPAWLYGRARRRDPAWAVFLAVPAIAVWLALTASGVGPQSMSNLIEVPLVVAAATVLYYLKVFVADRLISSSTLALAAACALAIVAAVLLRLFMPLLPE